MRILLIGIGAAGNKAVMEAVDRNVVPVEDTIIINSTEKDFPAGYDGKKIILSPDNSGCGKERAVAKKYALNAIQHGELNFDVSPYRAIILATSVEGGTGSGSAPILAKYFKNVANKNVHLISFIGFEEDVRGLSNTIEFFQEVTDDIVVQSIKNSAFLREAGGNKFKAEELANIEMCERIRLISGKDFIASGQNIDDTDIMKVANTHGYMTVEHAKFVKPLVDKEDFDSIIKKMLYNSKSLKSTKAVRMGIVLNIDPASEDAIDFNFERIVNTYGIIYEKYIQKQWDGKEEYIGVIISGLQMPIEEVKATYERYKEETDKVNKNSDEFFAAMKEMQLNEEDSKFDMIKPMGTGMSTADFLKEFGGL